ncbi:MAG TPA: serine protease [Candidatus Desulfofervidus auxilii]|uniref:Serine protease n=1 Tax=Desulfofervidus auxilii TaxID=1621989 RepID=A0A7C0Y894_DESA2|nr:serine protease [Candidatus Desulfofervidus auxilii]
MVEKENLLKMAMVREAAEEEVFLFPNVVGVGIGFKTVGGQITEEICIKVYVEKKLPQAELAAEAIIPAEYEGIPLDVEEVGKIEAQVFKTRLRPARPGYSIGHYRITAGTFGCLVKDVCCSEIYILSNNHVLANSNVARIGDPILQPGRYDGGSLPNDLIANLRRFVRINFGDRDRYNLVDAAIAKPIEIRMVRADIINVGIPNGCAEVALGMSVKKSGRTTQTTIGRVIGTDVSIAVNYGGGRIAYFRDQILTTNMSAGGDSGSILLDTDGRVVGLLFAGSSRVTVHNKIQNVLMALRIKLIKN